MDVELEESSLVLYIYRRAESLAQIGLGFLWVLVEPFLEQPSQGTDTGSCRGVVVGKQRFRLMLRAMLDPGDIVVEEVYKGHCLPLAHKIRQQLLQADACRLGADLKVKRE